jgi:hypothetical protein
VHETGANEVFKRITWMGIGMAVGATGAFRAKRKVEEAVERYLPEQVADRAAASARGLSQAVRAAAAEGRAAMHLTESELRARVDARTFVGSAAVPDDGAAAPDPATGRVPAEPRPAPGPRRTGRTAGPAPAVASGRRRSRR